MKSGFLNYLGEQFIASLEVFKASLKAFRF